MQNDKSKLIINKSIENTAFQIFKQCNIGCNIPKYKKGDINNAKEF